MCNVVLYTVYEYYQLHVCVFDTKQVPYTLGLEIWQIERLFNNYGRRGTTI